MRRSRQDEEQQDRSQRALYAARAHVAELGRLLRGSGNKDLAALEDQCCTCDSTAARMLLSARDDILKSTRKADAMLDGVSLCLGRLSNGTR